MYTENKRIRRIVTPPSITYYDDVNRLLRVILYNGYVSPVGGNGFEYHPNGCIRLTENGFLDKSDPNQHCILRPDGKLFTYENWTNAFPNWGDN